MKIDTGLLTGWKVATKTKPIKAKPLISIMVDRTVTNKFLLDTLEGKEPLGDGVVICIGETMDGWQQTPKKLLQKYDVVGIDKDGWMDCQPKIDNAVDVIEVDRNILKENKNAINTFDISSFYIIGLWGETVGEEKNVQHGVIGDFICRNRTDLTDVWIVRRKLFLNTYSIVT